MTIFGLLKRLRSRGSDKPKKKSYYKRKTNRPYKRKVSLFSLFFRIFSFILIISYAITAKG